MLWQFYFISLLGIYIYVKRFERVRFFPWFNILCSAQSFTRIYLCSFFLISAQIKQSSKTQKSTCIDRFMLLTCHLLASRLILCIPSMSFLVSTFFPYTYCLYNFFQSQTWSYISLSLLILCRYLLYVRFFCLALKCA